MKRLFAIILAVLVITAALAACGSGNSDSGSTPDPNREVKTSVSQKYNDDFAKNYAKSTTTDDKGNVSYEFIGSQYDEYIEAHKKSLAIDLEKDISSKHDEKFGQYAYINIEQKAVIIGVNPGQYDEASAKAEAAGYAEYGFKYFMSLENPVNTISVIYANANDQSDVYGSFEFTAE